MDFPAINLKVTDTPPAADFQILSRALAAVTDEQVKMDMRPLAVLLHGGDGATIGGLWGYTGYGWLMISLLFVPADLRGQGVGKAIVREAEKAAVSRGCRGIMVDGFSFQVGVFYERLGFTPFGALGDFPPGHRRVFYQKRLGPAAL